MVSVAFKMLIAVIILFVIALIMMQTLTSDEKKIFEITGRMPPRISILALLIKLLSSACIICFIISIFE